ncbi:hypothetical protein B0F90DRAFT_1885680 [Multifurca ochricompacta]|uniref:Uncharacterized protein n=1 Tax=Multifurca ochricompacta TaxID=376703 RepID=A0AAD4M869_9AGAM|nr:hypothetical protein B0F90DRAFT_1885680 [Multifurca ochricompacta]
MSSVGCRVRNSSSSFGGAGGATAENKTSLAVNVRGLRDRVKAIATTAKGIKISAERDRIPKWASRQDNYPRNKPHRQSHLGGNDISSPKTKDEGERLEKVGGYAKNGLAAGGNDKVRKRCGLQKKFKFRKEGKKGGRKEGNDLDLLFISSRVGVRNQTCEEMPTGSWVWMRTKKKEEGMEEKKWLDWTGITTGAK